MKGRVCIFALLSAALVGFAASASETPYTWHLPPGVAPPPVPADNPMSAGKVELGRRLFYDADLSIDGTTSCGTCHEQHRAFTEGNASHPGVRGAQGRRNVMALANVAYFSPLTWAKPSLDTLEHQVLVPMLGDHPVEMGMAGKETVLVERLTGDDCYRQMFAAAFPEEGGQITVPAVAKAISTFERTLLSFDSPYDRYRRGDRNAIDAQTKRGATLFFSDRFGCAACHSGPNFTDGKFHNIGLYDFDGADARSARDPGLIEESRKPEDRGRFRTPGLRNVALTGPYMHDGSIKSLSYAVRRHFAPGSSLAAVNAGEDELADLVAFLGTLTDRGFVTDPRFALPKTACGKKL